VTNMFGMFQLALVFNGDISTWNTSKVTNMAFMFSNAVAFNRDLSSWCVTLIPTVPSNFATNTPSWVLAKPNWGTCPP
jgi:hypothetical protein